MRGTLAAAVLLFAPSFGLAQGLPGAFAGLIPRAALSAPDVQAGTIGAVDRAGMSFVCQWAAGNRTYWVTRATRFRTGAASASFFDLGTGDRAQVTSHRSGRFDVADVIDFRT